MSLNYRVYVEGIKIKGHPITIFASDLKTAAGQFDKLSKKYPYNLVVLEELKSEVIKVNEPLEKPLPKCPYNHTGTTLNGTSVIIRNSFGKAYCQICGWKED